MGHPSWRLLCSVKTWCTSKYEEEIARVNQNASLERRWILRVGFTLWPHWTPKCTITRNHDKTWRKWYRVLCSSKSYMKQVVGECVHRIILRPCCFSIKLVLWMLFFNYPVNTAVTHMIWSLPFTKHWMLMPVRMEQRCEHAADCPIWTNIDTIRRIFAKLSGGKLMKALSAAFIFLCLLIEGRSV
jgi:hypothetical protein